MFGNIPRVTRLLLIANVGVFIAQALLPGVLEQWFALWPVGVGFEPWQLFSYAFLHGGVAHIAFNMFGLVMFGSDLERVLGAKRYFNLYIASVLTAAVMQVLVTDWLGQSLPTVGASGGVYGLVLGFAMLFPERRVVLLFPPIPMRARVFALVFAILELVLGVSGQQTGVAHFAHLGGMFGGWVMLRHWLGQRGRAVLVRRVGV